MLLKLEILVIRVDLGVDFVNEKRKDNNIEVVRRVFIIKIILIMNRDM